MRAATSLLRAPLVAFFLCVLYAPLALSQTAPAKQFRVILTYPPGGASDIMGRIIAQKLGEIWGQTVLVENRSGANGSIGIEYAARQPAGAAPGIGEAKRERSDERLVEHLQVAAGDPGRP